MSNGWVISMAIILGFLFIFFYMSQTRFKNKMLCVFHRPNQTKIEKWVPLSARFVVFDQGRYGIGQYELDQECIELEWYDRGFNKFFPTLIPTLEFNWDTPNPLNFKKGGQSSWHTPEVRYAAWQEHNHNAYAKATAAQSGMKQNKFFTVLVPLIIIGLLVIGFFVIYTTTSGLQAQIYQMQQQIKVFKP